MDYEFISIKLYDMFEDVKCDYRGCNEKADVRINTHKQNNLDGNSYFVCREHLKKIKENFDTEYNKIQEYYDFVDSQNKQLEEKRSNLL